MTSPLDGRLTVFLFFCPISFAFVSGLSLDLFELVEQPAFVIELMHMGRVKFISD